MAYQTLVSEATGFSPFKMVFGKEMRLGIDPIYKIKSESNDPTDQVQKPVNDFVDVNERSRNVMKQRVEHAANRLSAKTVQ